MKLIDKKTCMVQFNDRRKQIVDKKKLVPFDKNLEDKPWRYDEITMARFFATHDALKKKIVEKDKLLQKLNMKLTTINGYIAASLQY